MKLSKAKAARATRRASLDWKRIRDPRKARGKRHPLPGILNLLVSAMASGSRTLRDVETFCDDSTAQARKALGLKRAASDTATDALLRATSAAQMPSVLERQVKEGLKTKSIVNDDFDEGVVAIDGKKVWVGKFAAHRLCQQHTCDDGRPYWMLFAQRAVLISSSAKPCMGQHFIANKEAETSEFADFFGFLQNHYGKSFEMVTSDAGACSRKNARVIHTANKGYLFSLKENQPNLLHETMSRLGSKGTPRDELLEPELKTIERYRGRDVIRELFRVQVEPGDSEIDMAGVRQLWRIRQTQVRRNRHGKMEREVEDRYFITNRVLSGPKALRLVRLHWGIENNAFWTLDMVLGEDEGSPCQRGEALVVISWLRLLAYNIVSLWRSKLPTRHGDKPSWRRAADLLARVFTDQGCLEPEEAPATLA